MRVWAPMKGPRHAQRKETHAGADRSDPAPRRERRGGSERLPGNEHQRRNIPSVEEPIRRNAAERTAATAGAARRERPAEATRGRPGPAYPGAQGGERKKMVSPAQKRRAAGSVVGAERCSRRQACRYLGLPRSTWHYTPLPPTPRQIQLEREIVALSRHHPRYGYRRIHAVLPRKG